MTEKIVNGDYVKGETGLEETEYIAEVLQNAAIALETLRGSFYPDKNYGSRLRKEKILSEEYALCFARQALSGFDGVYIKSAKTNENGCEFTVVVNGQERQVLISACV